MSRRTHKKAFDRRYSKPGTAPGTLVVPQGVSPEVVIRRIDYEPDFVTEKEVTNHGDLGPSPNSAGVTWIDITGLSDLALFEALGSVYRLHRLALEDVLNCGQRPKIEDYGDHLFAILRSLAIENNELTIEQVSLFVGNGWVISIQERAGDSWDVVRERIRHGRGLIRKRGADYLAYALMDALVDEFFPVLERFGEVIEEIDAELLAKPTQSTVRRVYQMKRQLLSLRRTAWPQRDLFGALLRDDTSLIAPETRIFLRDCHDHQMQAMDLVETYRELAGGMVDLYMSSVSNRMNEVMKILTILSAIFIPMTFVAGIYGMNFSHDASPLNMPELEWFWGYPFALGLMAAIALAMVVYFKRKGWLEPTVTVAESEAARLKESER